MSIAKYLLIGGVALFAGVGLVGYFKKPVQQEEGFSTGKSVQVIQEIALPKGSQIVKSESLPSFVEPQKPQEIVASPQIPLPEADRIPLLFVTDSSKLPIVETVSYTSRVPWVQGRPAWIADYASHYSTSRHFIARSLNKKIDYFSQKISLGDRFNVFNKELNLQFYLLADLSLCKMWFYYLDVDKNERVLLKTYPIGVGRLDPKSPSGSLTPIGKYSLGDKVAIYKKGTLGYFQDSQVEMIRVFGTRWIPFDQEMEGCSAPAKGFGLQGAPWIEGASDDNALVEDRSKVGKYDSDGCIRLNMEDIEEIFAIVLTKPTTVEIVKNWTDATLPGVEKEI